MWELSGSLRQKLRCFGDKVKGIRNRSGIGMAPMQRIFGTRSKRGLPPGSVPGLSKLGTREPFEGADGAYLRVTVPDQVTKDWMEQEYAEEIRHAIHELSLEIDRIVYIPSARRYLAALRPLKAAHRSRFSPRPAASSIRSSGSTITSWALPINSRMPRPARLPTALRAATTLCSSMAAWAWERHI